MVSFTDFGPASAEGRAGGSDGRTGKVLRPSRGRWKETRRVERIGGTAMDGPCRAASVRALAAALRLEETRRDFPWPTVVRSSPALSPIGLDGRHRP